MGRDSQIRPSSLERVNSVESVKLSMFLYQLPPHQRAEETLVPLAAPRSFIKILDLYPGSLLSDASCTYFRLHTADVTQWPPPLATAPCHKTYEYSTISTRFDLAAYNVHTRSRVWFSTRAISEEYHTIVRPSQIFQDESHALFQRLRSADEDHGFCTSWETPMYHFLADSSP